jgi:Ankyrin repeats (many copies)
VYRVLAYTYSYFCCRSGNKQLTSTHATESASSQTPRDKKANFDGAEISRDDVDDGDEEFIYPGVSVDAVDLESQYIEMPQQLHPPSPVLLESQEFIYPGASVDYFEHVPQHVEVPRQCNPPSAAQLESLCAAASSGDLPLLKRLFRNALETGDVEPFGLANDASSRTGFTALHVAASRGYLEMVKWRKILFGYDEFTF